MATMSEGKRWLHILWVSMLFAIVASPFMNRLTGAIFAKMGVRSGRSGCPALPSLALNTIIFAVLLRLMMLIPFLSGGEGYEKSQANWGYGNPGYNGPTGGESVLECNAAQLAAQNVGCKVCSDAAMTCMRHPFTKDCENARVKCTKECPNKEVAAAVDRACNIEPVQDWLAKGSGCGNTPDNGWAFRWWG